MTALWYHAPFEDAEAWHGGFDTRAEAVANGDRTYDDYFFVALGVNPPLRLADWIGADDILERATETLADSDRTTGDEDQDWFAVTVDQAADLAARLRQACDDWQAAHGLVFTCWCFAAMSPPERIDVALPGQTDAEGEA